MPSSQLLHPAFPSPPLSSPPRNNNHNEEEQKEDETITDNTQSTTDVLTHSLTVFSKSTAHLNSAWSTLQQLYHSDDLRSHTQQTRLFLRLLEQIFIELSPKTQISLCFISFGLILILIQLPTTIIIATIIVSIGIIGIISIITQKYVEFTTERGLISLLDPGIIKRFILRGSIVDIFWQIRNSNLGIPDFLLSQFLPLDDPEREMIFERLPEITRNIVSTEGLIYLTPKYIQNIVLPHDSTYHITALSPMTQSPHSQADNNEQNTLRIIVSDEDTQQQTEPTPKLLSSTKHEIEDLGMKWLWKHQQMDEKQIIINEFDNESDNDDESSSDLSSSLSDDERENDNDNDEKKVEILDPDDDGTGRNQPISWFAHGMKLLGVNNPLSSKSVLKTIIDTRMKELFLQMIGTVWKSPFSGITDAQLCVLFILSFSCVSYYLTKNKKARTKFIKSIKYMSFMVAFWMAILCFIELNVRRKSTMFEKIWKYINKQLFHSKHYRDLLERKKSYSDLKKSQSMRIYSEQQMSRLNLLKGMKTRQRQIQFRDKKSKFSRTMPFIQSASPRSARSVSSASSMSDYSRLDLDAQPLTPVTPLIPSNRPKFTLSLTQIPDDVKAVELDKHRSMPPYT